MKRLNADELRAAQVAQDWRSLWEQALPLVKFAVNRFAMRGVDRALCSDDMIQDGNIAAGKAVRSWNPDKGEFSTWILARVEGAIRNHLQRTLSGMVGGRDSEGRTGFFEDERFADVEELVSSLEQEDEATRLGDALAQLTAGDQKILALRYGVGGEKTLQVQEIAIHLGWSQSSVKRVLAECVKKLTRLLRKPGNIYGSRRNTDD